MINVAIMRESDDLKISFVRSKTEYGREPSASHFTFNS